MLYSSPGPTIRAKSGKKLAILFSNNIKGNHLFEIDKSLITDPYKEINVSEILGVPVVIHAHGMMVSSTSDGYPGSYVTHNGIKGPHYYTER
jgi:FtsP/CotA-like multicopper oxidase with cupredoxin domain